MEIILNKNRKKTAKLRENRFDISYAKNLTAAVAPFFPDNLFLKKTTLWKNHMPDGNRSKNSWKSVGGENEE